MARVVNSRIRLLLLVIVISFGVLLGRAAWISTVRAASLSKLAQAQTKAPVVLPAGRGTIFDSMGTPLALGEQATTVYADPRQVVHPATAAKVAARALGLKAGALYPLLADRTHGFVYIERKAPADKATALAKLKLPGFGFYAEERRTYPQGAVAAPVLGYAGVDNKGLAGLELQLDGKLTGTPGRETIVRDPFGRPIDIQSVVPAKEGKAAFLTLDHTIQANAEQVLRATVAHWHAKDATAIVLDPKTGGVLAMAMEPGYDANNFPSAAVKELQRNHAVTDFFEPGSVFKVVTVAGALSEGLVSPQTKFTLPYSIRVADRVIHDAEPRGTETMTVAQILQRSSNVGAITIAKMLGKDRLLHWIDRFGFGKTTGIDFPGESAGLLPGYWSGSTIGNVPIGQGISVTAIQLAAVYAAIANGGVWTQPHLVDHMQGEKPPAPKTRRIVSTRVDRELLTMLKGVVSDVGTAAAAEIPGYSVAGKTGTAQKSSPRGGYAAGKYVATFVGMVPASGPKLLILVTLDEPKLAIFGGVVAAPAFAQIAAFDLQYLEVPPDLSLR
jgi:cell division protein FtsI (penicillin-binding protein 3)